MFKRIIIAVVVCLTLAITSCVLISWLRPLEVYAWLNRRALTRGGLQKSSVETSLGRQVFWQGGTGPTLVFLHGAGDNAGTWSQVAPKFLDKYRILVLDLPGHGESALNRGTVSIGVELQGLEEVLDKDTTGPVILVGNSMGAFIGMLYAGRNPLKVAHLILVNGGAARHEFKGVTLTPANREEARLWGESDRLVPVDYAEKMLKELSNGRITRLPRCGHVPQVECPNAFSQGLKQVLNQPPTAAPRGKIMKGALKER